MKTTGPILAIGAITMGNQVILLRKSPDWRVPIAAGLAAGVFAAFEKISPDIAVPLAYLALVSTLFLRVGGNPSPIESMRDQLVGVPEPRAPLQRG